MSSTLYPNTPGMVDDMPGAPAPPPPPILMTGSRLATASAAAVAPAAPRLYPNTPGMRDDMAAARPVAAPAADPASRLYPNTPGMRDDLAGRSPDAPAASDRRLSALYPNTPGMVDGPPGAADAEPDPAAVAGYAFDLPADFVVDEPMMDRFKATAVRHKLPPAVAAELLALHAESTAEAAPAPWRGREGWEAEALALPELRGDGREALGAVQALADDGVREFLAESGLGNHPQLVRWGLAVGRELRRLRAETASDHRSRRF